MMLINGKTWRVLISAIMVCGLSLLVAGGSLYELNKRDSEKGKLLATNSDLLVKLQAAQAALQSAQDRNAHNVALALQRQLALTRFALALQAQVRSLGATPLPLPPSLRTPPAYEGSTPTPVASSTPTPSARPSPRPTEPSPRPAPSPTPSPTCLVKAGPVCL